MVALMGRRKTWMGGSSPSMTTCHCFHQKTSCLSRVLKEDARPVIANEVKQSRRLIRPKTLRFHEAMRGFWIVSSLLSSQ